jgi:hypothetical protein
MEEKIYIKGINTFEKNAKAPDFVLGNGVITIDDFKEFINSNQQHLTEYQGKKQLRFQITMGKDNKVKFTVDTYKPTAKTEPTAQQNVNEDMGTKLPTDGLPF